MNANRPARAMHTPLPRENWAGPHLAAAGCRRVGQLARCADLGGFTVATPWTCAGSSRPSAPQTVDPAVFSPGKEHR